MAEDAAADLGGPALLVVQLGVPAGSGSLARLPHDHAWVAVAEATECHGVGTLGWAAEQVSGLGA